jgi:hypothetical protein
MTQVEALGLVVIAGRWHAGLSLTLGPFAANSLIDTSVYTGRYKERNPP